MRLVELIFVVLLVGCSFPSAIISSDDQAATNTIEPTMPVIPLECGPAPDLTLRDDLDYILDQHPLVYDTYDITFRVRTPFVPEIGGVYIYQENHGRMGECCGGSDTITRALFSFAANPPMFPTPELARLTHNRPEIGRWIECEYTHGRTTTFHARLRVIHGSTVGISVSAYTHRIDHPNELIRTTTGIEDGRCVQDIEVSAQRVGHGPVPLHMVSVDHRPIFGAPGEREMNCFLHVTDTPTPCPYGTMPGNGGCRRNWMDNDLEDTRSTSRRRHRRNN